MNEITITGNVVDDPKLLTTPQGAVRATFRLASSHRYFSRVTNEWVENAVTFIDVACWRQLAENVLDSLVKGQPVIVTGVLHVRSVQSTLDPTQTRTFVEIEAKAVGPDLAMGKATFERVKSAAVAQQEARATAEALGVAHQAAA